MKSPILAGSHASTPPKAFTKYSLLGTGAELERYATEQTPLLGDICLKGEATVWYGRYNTGKTLKCIHLLMEAIARQRIRPGSVFYINADDSSAGLAEKVKLFEEFGAHMLAPGHKGFDISLFTVEIENMIATDTCNGVLIIVDTLKKMVDVMDKKAVRSFTGLIRRFVMKQGTLLALAHTNKSLGKDGKPVPEGTADILSDFDCGYLIDVVGTEQRSGDRLVEFTCVKSRGCAAPKASYAYDPNPELTYTERLCSVREVDLEDEKYRESCGVQSNDAEIIEAIHLSIKHNIPTKMNIVRTAANATKSSRRSVLRVLEQHTGPDPAIHLWDFEIQERGKMVFTSHAAPVDPG